MYNYIPETKREEVGTEVEGVVRELEEAFCMGIICF
jgi:hypothetical protein